VERLREAGIDAVLVGTALMAAKDIGAKIKELFDM
jgi:indole-3-glycerol phosphate synthase